MEQRICEDLLAVTPLPSVLASVIFTYLRTVEFVFYTAKPPCSIPMPLQAGHGLYHPEHIAQKRDDGKFECGIATEFTSVSKRLTAHLQSGAKEMELECAPHLLGILCDFIVHHKGVDIAIIDKPLRSKVMRDVCQDVWDADYIDCLGTVEERCNLYEIIKLAHDLEIVGLCRLGCAKVASLLKGQPLNKMRDILKQ